MRFNPQTQLSLSNYLILKVVLGGKKVVNSVILLTPFRLTQLTSWSCHFQIYSDGVSNTPFYCSFKYLCPHDGDVCLFWSVY